MAADPTTVPLMANSYDPIDLLIALEEATDVPLRPEYVEGAIYMPPPPDNGHNDGALELVLQLRSAGLRLAGIGNGFAAEVDGREIRALVIPDFYVMSRKPTDLDEAFRKVHRGWYPTSLLALAGEVTSTNHRTDTGPKYQGYAAVGVPVYVLIHRQEKRAYAHHDPDPADRSYRGCYEVPLGEKLPLPAPYPALDTSSFCP